MSFLLVTTSTDVVPDGREDTLFSSSVHPGRLDWSHLLPSSYTAPSVVFLFSDSVHELNSGKVLHFLGTHILSDSSEISVSHINLRSTLFTDNYVLDLLAVDSVSPNSYFSFNDQSLFSFSNVSTHSFTRETVSTISEVSHLLVDTMVERYPSNPHLYSCFVSQLELCNGVEEKSAISIVEFPIMSLYNQPQYKESLAKFHSFLNLFAEWKNNSFSCNNFHLDKFISPSKVFQFLSLCLFARTYSFGFVFCSEIITPSFLTTLTILKSLLSTGCPYSSQYSQFIQKYQVLLPLLNGNTFPVKNEFQTKYLINITALLKENIELRKDLARIRREFTRNRSDSIFYGTAIQTDPINFPTDSDDSELDQLIDRKTLDVLSPRSVISDLPFFSTDTPQHGGTSNLQEKPSLLSIAESIAPVKNTNSLWLDDSSFFEDFFELQKDNVKLKMELACLLNQQPKSVNRVNTSTSTDVEFSTAGIMTEYFSSISVSTITVSTAFAHQHTQTDNRFRTNSVPRAPKSKIVVKRQQVGDYSELSHEELLVKLAIAEQQVFSLEDHFNDEIERYEMELALLRSKLS
ncbi:hypothetical protein RCL1_001517 [Eukaryota sp. TZLM3-RCL]